MRVLMLAWVCYIIIRSRRRRGERGSSNISICYTYVIISTVWLIYYFSTEVSKKTSLITSYKDSSIID